MLLGHPVAAEAWIAGAAWRVTCRPAFTDARGTTPEQERKVQAELVRCLFGNPFRPVEFRAGWRSEAAARLATAIHADRAFDRLPVLADALEEAGCDAVGLLAHCRHGQSHARGCRTVDAALGRV